MGYTYDKSEIKCNTGNYSDLYIQEPKKKSRSSAKSISDKDLIYEMYKRGLL